jgi:hypothetical protein|tara:strand:- start:313 stop:1050 length:738 start_codon:yes stop_codon:yes gene_type:complete
MIRPFSYKEYVHIIDWIKSNYNIVQYSDIDINTKEFCVIRHDIEYSIERAYELAKLEETMGLKTTYLVQIRNNCYNALSVKNVSLIQKIHDMGHEIGLHVHRGLLHSYKDVTQMIKDDVDILSKAIQIDTKVFSFHRPSIELLTSNLKVPGLINAYGDLYFHAYEGRQPERLNVKYISDSNHTWKYGYPSTSNNTKLQLNFHPFSWTKKGHENTPNFKTLITEKNKEMVESMSNEIRTFPTDLLL